MGKISIIGVGAIGGITTALLETTGRHELTLCTRRPMQELIVRTAEGVIAPKAKNLTDPAGAAATDPAGAAANEPVDWVFVATKVYDAGSAAAWFPRLCRPDTPIAILQNGVEHVENFQAFARKEMILPVIVDCPAERQADGSVIQRGVARMQVGNNPLGARFAELFRGSNVAVTLEDDFLSAAWKKLCLNAAGAVSALLMKPAGVLQDEALGQIVLEIIAECMAVGRAEGARLDAGLGPQILARFRSAPPDSINSILADRLAGRPMEIDARNGVIVRKGNRHGIGTPVNKMMVALLNGVGAG